MHDFTIDSWPGAGAVAENIGDSTTGSDAVISVFHRPVLRSNVFVFRDGEVYPTTGAGVAHADVRQLD